MKTTQPNRFPFAHTFSIVARDPQTGQMGVAVQSHWFSTGSIVTWAEAGVGAIATQSMVEVSYGPKGLDALRAGVSPVDALDELLKADEGREVRQVAMIDATGKVAVHTGSRCIAEAGHVQGDQFSVQANMMLKDTVWPAMAKVFKSASGDLTDRMLAALDAAQAEGGDIRGMQSAAILVVEGEKTEKPWAGVLVDLRVEDSPTPLIELRRLVNVQRAYQSMNLGDALLSEDKIKEAFEAYDKAARLAPHIDELPFWQAVTLADSGRVDEAIPILKKVFRSDPNWALLLQRLPAAGLFKAGPEVLQRILHATRIT
jgi:uncharacterized Ntn-hydrolase superfamily protein